jgi:NAD(P)-dependent dehydrogenase (short-subunit alcohol dehydrogenase family)
VQLDLSSLASVKNFATEFAKKKRKLSVLINNAAIALNPRDLTPKVTNDGLELTMVTNHLGMLLTFQFHLFMSTYDTSSESLPQATISC